VEVELRVELCSAQSGHRFALSSAYQATFLISLVILANDGAVDTRNNAESQENEHQKNEPYYEDDEHEDVILLGIVNLLAVVRV